MNQSLRGQKISKNTNVICESSLAVLQSVYVAVPKQNTEYQYWKHTEVSLPV